MSFIQSQVVGTKNLKHALPIYPASSSSTEITNLARAAIDFCSVVKHGDLFAVSMHAHKVQSICFQEHKMTGEIAVHRECKQ